jgi:EamA domain-containing membrane protein RarD
VSRTNWEKWIAAVALFAALAASVAWGIIPAYNDGITVVEENGDHVYVFLVLPVLFAALPLLASGWRHQATVISAWLLLAFCVVTGFTIGFFYWPSFVLMVAAAYAGARERRRSIVP